MSAGIGFMVAAAILAAGVRLSVGVSDEAKGGLAVAVLLGLIGVGIEVVL